MNKGEEKNNRNRKKYHQKNEKKRESDKIYRQNRTERLKNKTINPSKTTNKL